MERDDTNYLDALSEVSDQSKGSIAIFSVPLGIMLVQLRYLATVDHFLLQLFATIGITTLFFATVLAWFIAVTIQSTYAMELYRRDGKESEKEKMYAAWIQSLAKRSDVYTEEYALGIGKRLLIPFWFLASIGYLFLFVLVLIWHVPNVSPVPESIDALAK